MGGVFQLFWTRGQNFQELENHPLFGLYVGLRTVMAHMGVSFSLLMDYNECILRLKV